MFLQARRRLKAYALAVVYLSLTTLAVNPETLPFKSYTMSDGLAHDRVNRIVRDSRGFMWFCTSEGLSRFDGYEFKNYTQDDGLPHRGVSDFLETRSGNLWIATGDGLVLFDPRGRSAREANVDDQTGPMFRVFRPAELRFPAAQVWYVEDLIEDRNGTVWIGSSDGVYRIEKRDDWVLEQFEIPAAIENKNYDFAHLLEDHTGEIWAATEAGLYRISADRSSVETLNNTMRVGSLMEDRQGRVWIGSVGGEAGEIGLHIYSVDEGEPRKIRTFRQRDGLVAETWLNAVLETSDGRIYVGVGNGLCEYAPHANPDEPQFRVLNREGIVSLAEDANGNVWFSTNSSGVRRLTRGGFINFDEADNLAGRRITSIISSSDGNVYILAEMNKINRFDGKTFALVQPREMMSQSWGRGQVSFRDHTGAWWIAGAYGLQRYPPVEKLEDLEHVRPLRTYTAKDDGLFSDVVFHLFEDSRGDIWIGTIGGIPGVNALVRWERSTETLHPYTTDNGLPASNAPTAFGEDRAGNIWIGYYNGPLVRLRNEKAEVYGPEDNLPPGYIYNVFTDSNGRLWVATTNGGVVRIDDPTTNEKPRLVQITTNDGLSSNQATCTTEDKFGRIYISTGRGLDRLDPRTGRIKVFTKADGLPENIITQCKRDAEDALWFGTWNGLARFIPTAEDQSPPPPVFLSDLRVNGESAKKLSQLGETNLEDLDLTSEQRQIQIDFFALGYGVGESLRYQYKLDDSDRDWSEPTTQRTVNLNLSPGSYSFLVRAINAEGVASEIPARVSFTIARPIWQRWWFLLLMATAIALTSYVVYRYRVAQLLKLERVRTRIASDLHDDIGSSLSQIAILSEVARHKAGDNGAAEPLRRIADTSRDMVDSMSDIVWAINPQKDHLSDVIHRMRRFAGDTFDSTDIGYKFEFDEATHDVALGADLRRETYLVFKECVNNIAKHSNAGNVNISVNVIGNSLIVTIADDGRGFDVAKTLGSESNGYGGNGLLNMRKRAERLGGEFAIESTTGVGTTIRFEVPTGGAAHRRNILGSTRSPGTRTTRIGGDEDRSTE
jgi:ligand-binding sensor domain-containing protein/signal transduction histidine kinase